VAAAPLLPNGIALRKDGSFLLADLKHGGVHALSPAGEQRPFLLEVDGVTLPAANFTMVDRWDRVWITISTRRQPRNLGYRADVDDGFVILVDKAGARIVADGIGFTNECQLDTMGQWLYVNETFGKRTSRYRVDAKGELGPKEVVTRYGHGTFPDGLAIDEAGGLWITSVVSNRVIHVAPDGTQHIVLEDSDPAHVDWADKAWAAGEMARPHLDTIKSRVLRNLSSLAFGGPDRRTAYLGCLLGDRLATFRAPVAGQVLAHWEWGA
jgi:sugar lactone lactonase YvrE